MSLMWYVTPQREHLICWLFYQEGLYCGTCFGFNNKVTHMQMEFKHKDLLLYYPFKRKLRFFCLRRHREWILTYLNPEIFNYWALGTFFTRPDHICHANSQLETSAWVRKFTHCQNKTWYIIYNFDCCPSQ